MVTSVVSHRKNNPAFGGAPETRDNVHHEDYKKGPKINHLGLQPLGFAQDCYFTSLHFPYFSLRIR
jgi:hypothetical protein